MINKEQDNKYAPMLFTLIRTNIGLLNYSAKQKDWDKLNPIGKEKFTAFARTVEQLKTIDKLEVEQPKKYPPEWNEWRKDIFSKLGERRTYKLTAGQKAGEAKQITWLFKQGYTPEQIIKTFDTMNSQPFWSDKPLTLMTVAKQIGALMNGTSKTQTSIPEKQWRTTPLTKEEALKRKDSWDKVLAQAKQKVSIPNYQTWLNGSVGIAIEGETLIVGVKGLFIAEYLRANQISLLEKFLSNLHSPLKNLVFVVKPELVNNSSPETLYDGQGEKKNTKTENVPPKNVR